MKSRRANHDRAEQELQASAARLTALIENLRTGILVEDESRRIVHINQELCTLFGIPTQPRDLIGADCSRATIEVNQLFADPEGFVERTEEILRERRPVTGEEWTLTDGRTFERDYIPVFASDEPRGHLWQYRDITERKRAEEALRASQDKFRILFEQSPEAVLLIEPEDPWRIVDCNPAACEMNGYVHEELIGMPLAELDPRWVEPEVRRRHIEMLCRGHKFEGETIHRRKDGTIFPIEYSTSLISIEGGELILGIDRDITERKQAHDQLAESERRFATLLSNAPALVYRCLNEPDWPIEFVSDYALELTGYKPQEFVDGEIMVNDLILEGDRETVWNEVQAAITRGEPYTLEYSILHRDGRLRHVEEHGQAVYGQECKILALEGLISDITERKRAEERMVALSALGQRLSSANDAVSAARVIADVADHLIGWDAYTLLLYSPEEDLLYPVLDFDLVEGVRTAFGSGDSPVCPGSLSRQAMADGPQLLLPEHSTAKALGLQPFGDVSRPSASLMFVPIHSAAGVTGVLSIQSYKPGAYTEADLSTLQALANHCGGALERIRAEEALRESQERFRILFEHSPDGVLLMDPHDPDVPWKIVECNDAVCRINGYTHEELIGQSVAVLHSAKVEQSDFVEHLERLRLGAEKLDLEHRRKDGTLFTVEAVSSLITVGGREMVLGIERDITERKAFEEQLRHQAFHDSLTGLANRVLFMERLGHALVRSTRQGQPVAVLYLDLDRFKWVNDSLGHDAGDALLIAVGDRLQTCLRPGDTAARVGGDEFVVLLEDITGEQDARVVAERIEEMLCPAFEVAGRELTITTSVGIAMSTTGREGPYELVRAADSAMYRAKKKGKARYEVFNPEEDSRPTDALELEADLRHAIERGELRLYYQPKVELATGRIVGVEALLRWEHPRRGLVLPERFISIAEETGLILPIGRWILKEACRQAMEWQRQYPSAPPPEMSVNVSARQFGHPELIEEVGRALHDTGLNPRNLVLEITESAVMDNAESSVATLLELKDLGVLVAIDDFGTGYSSLSYLRRFPVDVIKIDRSFVDGLGLDSDDTAIVRAVIGLAHALRLEVVAEGVETDTQRMRLQALGCGMGQGFFFSKPLPVEEINTLLAHGTPLLRQARV